MNASLSIPDKRVVRQKLRSAVRAGKLIRPRCCSLCNREDAQIDGHHDDYNKPFDVKWLCTYCHRWLHGVFTLPVLHAGSFRNCGLLRDTEADVREYPWNGGCTEVEWEFYFAELSRLEAHLVRLRFGFQGGRSLTYREIAVHVGGTRQRAEQIVAKGLEKLRFRLKDIL